MAVNLGFGNQSMVIGKSKFPSFLSQAIDQVRIFFQFVLFIQLTYPVETGYMTCIKKYNVHVYEIILNNRIHSLYNITDIITKSLYCTFNIYFYNASCRSAPVL